VITAHAPEQEWAGVSAGFDVAGSAHPERYGDLVDPHPGVLVVQEGFGLVPQSAAVSVELEGDQPVDGLTHALLEDPQWWSRVWELSE
jgi:hypothetical protein